MSQNWRTKVLEPKATGSSYYNSPGNNKHSARAFGTPYRERLSANSDYDDSKPFQTKERATAYERIENYYDSRPRTADNNLKFSRTFTGRDFEDEKKNYQRSPVAASTATNFYSPNRKISSPLSSPGLPYSSPKSTKSHTKKTLVLDLDETLVHASAVPVAKPDFVVKLSDNARFYVLKRPGLDDFLDRMAELYDVVIYTSGEKEYATKIVDKIDPRHHIRYILHRDHCTLSSYGLDKDLLLIGKDLSGVIFIDNLDENFRLQRDNGLKILDFYSSRKDDELMKLIPFLEYMNEVPDVRPIKRWHSEFLTKDLHHRYSHNQSAKKRPESMYANRSNGTNSTRNLSTNESRFRSTMTYDRTQSEEEPYESESKYFSKDAARNTGLSTSSVLSNYRQGDSYARRADLDRTSSYLDKYSPKKDNRDLSYSAKPKSIEEVMSSTWTASNNPATFNEKSFDLQRSWTNYDNEPPKPSTTYKSRFDERVSEILKASAPRDIASSTAYDGFKQGGLKSSAYVQPVSSGSDSRYKVNNPSDVSKRSQENKFSQSYYSPQKALYSQKAPEENTVSRFGRERMNLSGDYGSWKAKEQAKTMDSPLKKNKEKSPLLEDLYERIAALERKFKAKNLKTLNF